MFGGTFKKEGTMIEGTYRQHAWQDTWESAHPITYDGELTPEVCAAIKAAFTKYVNSLQPVSSWGRLRWPSLPTFVRVDVEKRCVITHEASNLCD